VWLVPLSGNNTTKRAGLRRYSESWALAQGHHDMEHHPGVEHKALHHEAETSVEQLTILAVFYQGCKRRKVKWGRGMQTAYSRRWASETTFRKQRQGLDAPFSTPWAVAGPNYPRFQY